MEQTELSEQYRVWKGWDRENFGKETHESSLYYKAELERAQIPKGDLRVLEIGFGNAGFAAHAQARGYHYSGTEIDAELVARARDVGIDAHLVPGNLLDVWKPESFDLIAAFDVLEHLSYEEITAILGDFRILLRPGGHVIARFPSGDSPFSLGMYNGDITHRSHIGRGAIIQFCLAVGLDPVQIRHPVLPICGLGLRRALRRATVSAIRWLVRIFLRAVYFDGAPRVVEPNMLVVLKRPLRE